MTQKEWEKGLYRALKGLSREERRRIVEYYRELFADKRDAGRSEYEILLEFGAQEACAKEFLTARGGEGEEPKKAVSGGYIALIVCLSVLLILPLTCAVFGVVVGFGAVAVGGGACVLGGAVFAIGSLFFLSHGTAYVLAAAGIGVTLIGIGAVLAAGFYLLSKLIAVSWMRFLKLIYTRRAKHETRL